MEVVGKITIFPRVREVKGEKVCFVDGTISSKEGETYLNKKVEVRFNKEKFPQEKLLQLDTESCYNLEIEKGWLGVEKWTRKDNTEARELYIYVESGKLTGSKKVERPLPDKDGLPF